MNSKNSTLKPYDIHIDENGISNVFMSVSSTIPPGQAEREKYPIDVAIFRAILMASLNENHRHEFNVVLDEATITNRTSHMVYYLHKPSNRFVSFEVINGVMPPWDEISEAVGKCQLMQGSGDNGSNT